MIRADTFFIVTEENRYLHSLVEACEAKKQCFAPLYVNQQVTQPYRIGPVTHTHCLLRKSTQGSLSWNSPMSLWVSLFPLSLISCLTKWDARALAGRALIASCIFSATKDWEEIVSVGFLFLFRPVLVKTEAVALIHVTRTVLWHPTEQLIHLATVQKVEVSGRQTCTASVLRLILETS